MTHRQPWQHKYSISAKRKNYEREAFMKILKKGMFIAFLLGTAIAVMAQEAPLSYYIRANGNDQNNNGRSETTPFKTLRRAIEVASQGTIRRITIIGTLNQASEAGNSRDGVFVINYRGREELTITGKPDASQQQKAILSATGTNKRVVYLYVGDGGIRLENIEISGANIRGDGAGISIDNGRLTLGAGTKIVSNIASKNGGGLCISGGAKTFIEEGVEISQNAAERGAGICLDRSWNELTISGGNINNNKASGFGGGIYVDDASNTFKIETGNIANNVAENSGGGLYIAGYRESILMNVTVSENTAKNKGGGIYMGWGGNVVSSSENGANVVMDNCIVSNNKAEFGAGIYFHVGKFTLSSGSITGNSAEFVGGGIYVASIEKKPVNFIHSGGEVSGNQAGDDGDNIFIQQ
jgi:predicted outer membrane repeat protein